MAHLSYDDRALPASRYQRLSIRRETDMFHLPLVLGEYHDARPVACPPQPHRAILRRRRDVSPARREADHANLLRMSRKRQQLDARVRVPELHDMRGEIEVRHRQHPVPIWREHNVPRIPSYRVARGFNNDGAWLPISAISLHNLDHILRGCCGEAGAAGAEGGSRGVRVTGGIPWSPGTRLKVPDVEAAADAESPGKNPASIERELDMPYLAIRGVFKHAEGL